MATQAPSMTAAVEFAVHAPSVHNTQPWRWRVEPDAVQLFADRTRWLAATDPQGRDLMLSCGAALQHLQVALADMELGYLVDYLPDRDDEDHLATVRVVPGEPVHSDPAMARAILDRRTDRRWFDSRPVPSEHISLLFRRAAEHDSHLHRLDQPAMRSKLAAALEAAAQSQRSTFGYASELAMWTSRAAGAGDGVPVGSVPPPLPGRDAPPLRSFPRSGLAQPAVSTGSADAGTLLLVTSQRDDRRGQLRAGEAVSAVLLTATSLGLATTPLSQPIEVPETRDALRTMAASEHEFPQLIVRLGWPMPGAAPLPPTPRRRLSAVLI